jgi:hypothetical protein
VGTEAARNCRSISINWKTKARRLKGSANLPSVGLLSLCIAQTRLKNSHAAKLLFWCAAQTCRGLMSAIAYSPSPVRWPSVIRFQRPQTSNCDAGATPRMVSLRCLTEAPYEISGEGSHLFFLGHGIRLSGKL